MNQTIFTWDPAQDQTYSEEYGTQTYPATGAADGPALNKNPGKSFTMDAPGHSLTLNSDKGSTVWGNIKNNNDLISNINLKNGVFVFDGSNYLSHSFLISNIVNFKIDKDAEFNVRQVDLFCIKTSGTGSRFDVNGTLYANCATFIHMNNPLIIQNQAHMGISASQIALQQSSLSVSGHVSITCSDSGVDNCKVKNTTSLQQSKKGKNDLEENFHLESYKINCTSSASVLLQADQSSSIIKFTGATSLRIEDSATITIIVNSCLLPEQDSSTPDQRHPCFTIGKGNGNGKIKFTSITGSDPFDFRNKKYAPGLFNFVRDSKEDNKNQLILVGITNAFDFNYLLGKNLFAINGSPSSSGFNPTYQGDHTIITLK